MADFYRLRHHSIEIGKHPTFSTHYIKTIDIIDTRIGLTVKIIQGFSSRDGIEAAQRAGMQARQWIENANGTVKCPSTDPVNPDRQDC